jgi:hypothetical protein
MKGRVATQEIPPLAEREAGLGESILNETLLFGKTASGAFSRGMKSD